MVDVKLEQPYSGRGFPLPPLCYKHAQDGGFWHTVRQGNPMLLIGVVGYGTQIDSTHW